MSPGVGAERLATAGSARSVDGAAAVVGSTGEVPSRQARNGLPTHKAPNSTTTAIHKHSFCCM